MPTYDYQCDACGHEFELFQAINDPVKRKCPDCGKSKLRRLFGAGAAIVFKGSGFYQTDYRSESYKKSAKAEKEGTSAGSKDASAKSDAAGKDSGKADSAKKKASKPSKKPAD